MEYYVAYAQLLASWGFVVLQYNLPAFRIVKDAAEVGQGRMHAATFVKLCRPRSPTNRAWVHLPQMQCLEPLLAWLAEQNELTGSELHGCVALDRLGVAGHSRGAKLAALHFAGARLIYLKDVQ